MSQNDESRKPYSEIVVPILKEVGAELMKHYGKVEPVAYKSPAAHDPVTELDIWAEKFISGKLLEEYPEIGFAGEETGGNRELEKFWLCDPIDGTTHFMRGMPFCSTMLALIENKKPLFAAIYDFVNDNMYVAEKGMGATLNGNPIHVSDRSLSRGYVGWETHLDKKENLEKFMRLRAKCVPFKTVSSGFEHAMVAYGKLEARICFDPYGKDYDFAPGCLLVEEAGGIVRNLGQKDYKCDNLNYIAANPIVYKELTQGPEAIFPE